MALPIPSRWLCGVKITPTTMDDVFGLIGQAVEANEQFVLASQNLHGLYVHAQDPYFRRLHEDPATCVHIDGTPVLWLGKLFGLDLSFEHRTAWIDFFLPLLSLAQSKGWRVFYLGGTPEVLAEGLRRLRATFPNLQIDGRDGYFDATSGSSGNRDVVERIREFRPHLLIVGMGMGRQERWIVENKSQLPVNCIGTCGACLEYFAGAVRTPPRWLGRLGLEWTFRLLDDPKRFWKRYLLEPWAVVWYLAANGLRRRPASEPPAPVG